MRDTSFDGTFAKQKKSRNSAGKNRAFYPISILLGVIGGSLCGALGFLLFGFYAATGATDNLENYAGVGLVVAAFVFFGVAAHFMDKADANKFCAARHEIENSHRSNFDKKNASADLTNPAK